MPARKGLKIVCFWIHRGNLIQSDDSRHVGVLLATLFSHNDGMNERVLLNLQFIPSHVSFFSIVDTCLSVNRTLYWDENLTDVTYKFQ